MPLVGTPLLRSGLGARTTSPLLLNPFENFRTLVSGQAGTDVRGDPFEGTTVAAAAAVEQPVIDEAHDMTP